MEFCQRYDYHFIGQGHNSVDHARHYITGLMGTQSSKNIETIENNVARDASEAIGDDNEAKIPEYQRVYQPKWRQALDLVKRARTNKLRYGWVGADALYGNNHEFLNSLEDSGERFMADIHSNPKVWLEHSTLEKPAPRDGKLGQPTTKLKLATT